MVFSDNCRMAPCGKPPHGEGRIVESRGNNIFLLGRNFSTMPILPGSACSPGAQPTGSLSTTEWSVGDPGRLSGLSLQGLLLRSLLLSFSSVCSGSSSCLAPPAPPCPLLCLVVLYPFSNSLFSLPSMSRPMARSLPNCSF